MNYVGMDVHKKSISYCVRQADGTVLREGSITANRKSLDAWMRELPDPWMAGMEATLFTGWIYDHLVGRGATVKVAHSAMLKAMLLGRRRTISWMRGRSPTCCAVTIFRSATWRRARFGIEGGFCAIGICW